TDAGDKKREDMRDEDFLPTTPVKVGATWQPTPEKLEKMLQAENGLKTDTKRSSVQCKLMSVYKKDGVQRGTLEITITMFITEFEFGAGRIVKATPESNLVSKITVDMCLDGTSPDQEDKVETTSVINANIGNAGTFTIKGTRIHGHKVR